MVVNLAKVSDQCKVGLAHLHQDLLKNDPAKLLPLLEKAKHDAISGTSEDVEAFSKLVFNALLGSEPKSPLRQKFIGVLVDLRTHDASSYQKAVNEVAAKRLASDDLGSRVALFALLNDAPSLCEHSSPVNSLFDDIYDTYDCLWQAVNSDNIATTQKNELFADLLLLVKSTSSIIQKETKNPSSTISVSLLELSIIISSSNDMPLDLHNACGTLIVRVCRLNGWDLPDIVMAVSTHDSYFKDITDVGILSIFHGILCSGTPSQIVDVVDEFDPAGFMFDKSFECIKSPCNTEIILSCRIINHLVIKLLSTVDNPDVNFASRYEIHSKFSQQLVESVLLMWDHFLDSVKHLARDIFINYIKFHGLYDEVEAQTYFTILAQSLVSDLETKKYSYLALSYLVPLVSASSVLEIDKNLPVKLILRMSDSTYATHALTLLQALFENHSKEISSDQWVAVWFPALFDNYSDEMLPYGYESLINRLLSCKENCAYLAIERLATSDSKFKSNLLVICAKCILKIRNSSKNKLPVRFLQKQTSMWKDVLPVEVLSNILLSYDDNTSILAFNLVCQSPKTTELFEKFELSLIEEFLRRNITKSTPSFQQKVINNCKNLLMRINKGLQQKSKQGKNLKTSYGVDDLIKVHEQFLLRTFLWLTENLNDGSNPPRVYMSLSLIQLFEDIILDGCVSHMESQFYTTDLVHSLMLTMQDSYESNKLSASRLLVKVMNRVRPSDDVIQSLIQTSWKHASSCKPPDSITASCILMTLVNGNFDIRTTEAVDVFTNRRLQACWCVLERLGEEISCAKKSIFEGATSAPMYGLFQCLRQLMTQVTKNDLIDHQSWKALIGSILESCVSAIGIVEPVVNNDSPEGHLPMDFCRENLQLMKDIIGKSFVGQELLKHHLDADSTLSEAELVKAQAVTSQMLLLCGWRTIKESSLLLAVIVKIVSIGGLENDVISEDQIYQIGDVFLDLLINTKHRGAFEQANVGFNLICSSLWKVSVREIAELPHKWLQETLKAVGDIEHPRLCATRRSAGLPFIIQSILGTEPSSRAGKSLKYAIEQLFNYTKGAESEAKVHALNILRFLFRETRLADNMMAVVSEGVATALSIYKSVHWAERNAATLLLSSLFNRMIGIKRTHDDIHSKNSISAHVFFMRFPALKDLFLHELQQSADSISDGKLSLATYPVLMILARLAPVTFEGRSSNLNLSQFIPLILECSASPIHQLRVLASKAIVPLLTPSHVEKTIAKLCGSVSCKNQNQLHGSLLCLTQMIEHSQNYLFGKPNILEPIVKISWVARDGNKCFISRASAIDMFALILKNDLIQDHALQSMLSASCLSLLLSMGRHNSQVIGAYMALRSSATFLLVTNKTFQDINTYTFLFESFLDDAKEIGYHHAQSLDVYPPPLINSVCHQILTGKNTMKIKALMYSVLSQAFTRGQVKKCDHITLLKASIEDLKRSAYEDWLKPIILTCSHLVKMYFDNSEENALPDKNLVSEWMNMLIRYSDAECCIGLRKAVIEGLLIFDEEYHDLLSSKELRVPLVKLFIQLVLDDDSDVRRTGQEAASVFLSKSATKHEQKDGILSQLIHCLAQSDITDAVAILVSLALKEEIHEEFGLSEDRAFEKSEVNIYKKPIETSQICASVIDKRLSDSSSGILFPVSHFRDDLILPIPSSYLEDESISLEFLSKTVSRELEYISDHFTMSGFDQQHQIWYNRLAVRAHLYSVFKKYSKEQMDPAVRKKLDKNLFKSAHFNRILDMLA